MTSAPEEVPHPLSTVYLSTVEKVLVEMNCAMKPDLT